MHRKKGRVLMDRTLSSFRPAWEPYEAGSCVKVEGGGWSGSRAWQPQASVPKAGTSLGSALVTYLHNSCQVTLLFHHLRPPYIPVNVPHAFILPSDFCKHVKSCWTVEARRGLFPHQPPSEPPLAPSGSAIPITRCFGLLIYTVQVGFQ